MTPLLSLICLAAMRNTANGNPNQPNMLSVPPGFEVRLVAEVPAVEYPCQVATADDGALFVAEDPMDQRGPYEANDGRILRFAHGGTTGVPVVYASQFRAIQGMAWRDGALYVCHMPFLTVLRDRDGDGAAEQRFDLFTDLGLTNNQGLNDHIVSGIQFGMDGWLYISVGDKGVPGTKRPEDSVVVQIEGGGVLRCRPDGTALEVVSSGTRNHLEPNLDALDRIFTYDNTDDGLGWWTRLTHHIDGGYHGYPFDYHDRPDRFLDRMAEYGGGSPCGAVFYREAAWPEPFRGIGLWAEWGKGKVQAFRFQPRGATFEVAEAIDFVTADQANDFRPIDLAVSHDGRTLFIADWNLGAWGDPRKVGRVWAVSVIDSTPEPSRGRDSDPAAALIAALDHPAHAERMRAQNALISRGPDLVETIQNELNRRANREANPGSGGPHLVWILDALAGGSPAAALPLIDALKSRHPSLRREAARALGQRVAPIAVEALIVALEDVDPEVRLEASIALGRIGDSQAVPALIARLADSDPYLAFAARVALRRIGDWTQIAEGLRSETPALRRGILGVLEQQYQPAAARALLAHASDTSATPDERSLALQFVADLTRRRTPWNGRWWGTRPAAGAPPAHVVDWELTDEIRSAVRRSLDQSDAPVRLAAIRAIAANEDREALADLTTRFITESEPANRAAIADVLGKLRHEPAVPVLAEAIRNTATEAELSDAAIRALDAIGSQTAESALLELLTDGGLTPDRQPQVIAAIGKRRITDAVPVLLITLNHEDSTIRIAAVKALARCGTPQTAGAALRATLADSNADLGSAAADALGALRDHEAIPALVDAANRDATQFAATNALSRMPDIRALQIYLRGLSSKNPEERAACSAALADFRDSAVPILDRLADRHELSASLVTELRKVYATPQPLENWKILGPFERSAEPPFDTARPSPPDLDASYPALGDGLAKWTEAPVEGDAKYVDLAHRFGGDRRVAYGYTTIERDTAGTVDLVVGSDDSLTVWVNGVEVYDYAGDRGFEADQGRASVALHQGANSVLVRCGNSGGGWQFAVALAASPDHLFLRAPASGTFDSEAFRSFALENHGDAEQGRALFQDLKGLACVKCHKVDATGAGGDVGPNLIGIGARYARPELVDSILNPSAKIFSGYEPWVVATVDGQVLTGLLRGDDGKALTLIDAEARTVTIPHEQIEERRPADVSLMPSGLAEGLSVAEFADLIEYVSSLRQAADGAPAGNR